MTDKDLESIGFEIGSYYSGCPKTDENRRAQTNVMRLKAGVEGAKVFLDYNYTIEDFCIVIDNPDNEDFLKAIRNLKIFLGISIEEEGEIKQ